MTPPKAILSFWSPCNAVWPHRDIPLIRLWRDVWISHGWEPRVLGYADAIVHPLYEVYDAKVRSFPTLNSPVFEHLAFIRWLAFSLAGGGVLCDYDIFPVMRFPPRLWAGMADLSGGSGFYYAESRDIDRFILTVLGHDPSTTPLRYGSPHIADMILLQDYRTELFKVREHLTCCYRDPGWTTYPLVHFANNTIPDKVERVDLVRKVLDL